MSDALDRVLRLVADGRLTAEEAAPILDALSARGGAGQGAGAGAGFGAGLAAGFGAGTGAGAGAAPAADANRNDNGDPRRGARFARIEVREGGRRVVDLRIPTSLGKFALSRVPGLSADQVTDIEEAIVHGSRGPILDVEDEDGDGVRIVLE